MTAVPVDAVSGSTAPEAGQLIRIQGQQWVVSQVSDSHQPVNELAATRLPGKTLVTLTSVSDNDLGSVGEREVFDHVAALPGFLKAVANGTAKRPINILADVCGPVTSSSPSRPVTFTYKCPPSPTEKILCRRANSQFRRTFSQCELPARQQFGQTEEDRILMTPAGREDTKNSSETGGVTPGIRAEVPCRTCDEDLNFLRTTRRPDYAAGPSAVRVVDLFAGGGGLSLGTAEAARRAGRGTSIALAAEWDGPASDVYALNFPGAAVSRDDVAELFDGQPGSPLTAAERETTRGISDVDILLAGPPCQGHSDLNNHTRRNDPRNTLYLRAARAAEVLRPFFVIIENVPAVKHDKNDVVGRAKASLRATGYCVADEVLNLVSFGVPQRRKRHIMLAVLDGLCDPATVLKSASPCSMHDPRTVEWAIADLLGRESESGFDSPSRASADNLKRMQWLMENDDPNLPNSMRPECHRDGGHTYKAMYGRLDWHDPAPTITTGFGSMGQGRFVHPARPRTITPHEAARLQTLPDFFDLGSTGTRKTWAKVIGNAVPPLLGVHLVSSLLTTLPKGPIALESRPAVAHNEIRTPALNTPK